MSNAPQITQNFARPSYRPPEPAGLDPDMRRMAIIAACVGGVAAFAIGALSLSRSSPHSVPVIQPPSLPVRVKPANPGGMQVAGADDVTVGQGETLAPAAEKPAIRALRAKRVAKDVEHPVVAKLPVAEPVVKAPPAAPLAAPSAPQAVAEAATAGGTSVQLAAFDSEQAAQQDWGKMAEKMPKLFDGHRPEVTAAKVAGKTVYRLRTGGFATIATATAFCGEVRSRGGDCSIAAF
jgi:hypothetical protein